MDLTKLTDEQRDYFSRTSGPYLAAALKLVERAAIHAPIDEDVSKIIWG